MTKALLEATVIERTKEIVLEKENVEIQKKIVEEKNNDITDNINYAQRIQQAILPIDSDIKDLMPESFILFNPCDIVSGDFYWFSKISNFEFLIACVDCTGHGVPGAMLNVVCINAINKAIIDEGLNDPGKILDRLNQLVAETFMHGDRKDGMDLSFCVFNEKDKTLQWSGANNPLWVIKNDGTFLELKPNKQPIGLHDSRKEILPFKTHELKLQDGDSIYMFTDGFADQFGGSIELPKGKKMKSKPFLHKLNEIKLLEMEEQDKALSNFFYDWKGNVEQTDDVCLIGLKI
jgi:serine phosphatase RsbU (regulator of sigma subunit)